MITISSDRLICDIQGEFSRVFPFLKIKFFMQDYQPKRSSGRSPGISSQLKIGAASIKNMEASILIRETTTLKDLEKEFSAEFGIFVQVYRKSGNLWLETSKTRSWTMKKQNESGLELSTLLNKDEE